MLEFSAWEGNITNHHPEENTTDLGKAKVDAAVFDESLLHSCAGNIHDC